MKVNRALGIDYGDTRIGIALSDPLQIITKPYITLKNNSDFFVKLESIVNEKEVKIIVVGYPYGMKGQITKQTEKVDLFIDRLKQNIDIDVIKVDERLSSKSAENLLKKQGFKTGHNKSMIDDTSAAIILQEYIDSK
ncbi:MAG: Holliday junction resolvase RuvX [Candidatus Marinimicrobia bacterium]|nr:Holliday junction resolvase RuvX [Candidatus Neomarinimicrobiota bacterium]